MKVSRWLMLVFTLIGALNLAACDREGPLERAGESADRAAEDVGDRAEEATERER